MYSTCLFCNRGLGRNETIERFPVGRRLAFDSVRGRLWVVCRTCERWNLTPIETRWEAIEECERAFRDTRTRVSTENIGLARLPEGSELVRIGRAGRGEFAAWRYGARFSRRRGRARLRQGAGFVLSAAVLGSTSLLSPELMMVFGIVPVAGAWMMAGLARAGGPSDTGWGRQAHLTLRDDAGNWLLDDDQVIRAAKFEVRPRGWALHVGIGRQRGGGFVLDHVAELEGSCAVRALGVIMAGANRLGATKADVRGAVERIDRAGGPAEYFARAELEARRSGQGYYNLWGMPRQIRLALEMAAHEDSEREALEGELAALERQWRDAEEIAAVADRLAWR